MFFGAHSSYSVTKNPYLKRLLGEDQSAAQTELGAPEETLPSPEAPPPRAPAPPEVQPKLRVEVSPNVQQLAKLWQSGDKVGVATSLLYSEASHRDFVNLVYIIGQQAGLELGVLLDEMAGDSEASPAQPETPPQYSDILKRVGGDAEDGVV